MDDLWSSQDGPVPASYWMAAGLGSIVVLVSYATAWWVPWFLSDMAGYVPNLYLLGPGLLLSFATAIGLGFAAVPWGCRALARAGDRPGAAAGGPHVLLASVLAARARHDIGHLSVR